MLLRSPAGRARLLRASLLAAAAALLAGCTSFYVDPGTREVPVASIARPAQPRPVQLLVKYGTRGVEDPHATAWGRGMVVDAVRASGLFSEVRATPAEGAGVLTVALDHEPPQGAAGKAFIVGLSLGLIGQEVADSYTCTLSYAAAGQSQPIVKTAHHAIHMAMGSASAPPQAFKTQDAEQAARVMVRQCLSVTLDELSRDPQFK